MKTLIRNFTHTFRRFFTASVLNIVGLAVAFASFFVIMTQVDYDLNFNKGYKDYDKIFRVEAFLNAEIGWMEAVPCPLGEAFRTGSPHIKSVALFYDQVKQTDYESEGNLFNEPTVEGFGDFMDVFQPEMLSGSTDALNRPQTILIPESVARRIFGTTDAVGKVLFRGKRTDGKPFVVGGVYKDFPENSVISNCICMPVRKDEKRNSWYNWNVTCYLRLDDVGEVGRVESFARQEMAKGAPEMVDLQDRNKVVRLFPIADVHFSKVGNENASGRGMSYLLVCVSFLIVVVAAINFMNFSLAETPMRVRSVNTQKILGATTGSLRMGLVIESVIVSLVAFGVSLVLVQALHDSGVQDLVASDIGLSGHPWLLAVTFVISVLMGILAGVYPSCYVTSFQPALALKGSFGLSPKGRRLRTVLVCVQFFVSFVLVIAIGIMYGQSRYIRTADYGYDKDMVVVGKLTKECMAQTDAVVGELSRVSGVEGVSCSENLMGENDGYMTLYMRNREDLQFKLEALLVDERYFDVMGIRLTEGRGFKPGEENVLVASESARKAYDWFAVGQPGGGALAPEGDGEVHSGPRLQLPLHGPRAGRRLPQRASLHPPDPSVLPSRHRDQHDRGVRPDDVRERVPAEGDRHPQDIRQYHGRDTPHIQPALPVYIAGMLRGGGSLRVVDRPSLAGRIRREDPHTRVDLYARGSSSPRSLW